MTSISVVVPVYNEEGNVAELHREIKQMCEANGYIYEIIFVNDGSSDRTEEVCRTLRPLVYQAAQEFRADSGDGCGDQGRAV